MRTAGRRAIWLHLALVVLIQTWGTGCKQRHPSASGTGSRALTEEDAGSYARLLALGYDPSVARRIVSLRKDLLQRILGGSDQEAMPRISFRGIGVDPRAYDPTLRTGGYAYDGIYTAKDPRYALRYMNDNSGYAVLLEFQTPAFLGKVNLPQGGASFIDATEILLPKAAYPDDRHLLKCIGIKKKGTYDPRLRLTLHAVHWFAYDQAFDGEGRFKETVLDGWESGRGAVPAVATAAECVHDRTNTPAEYFGDR